ncbi:hypothetical protein WICMUC_002082, partial [Wickerhamomyces mucosus]
EEEPSESSESEDDPSPDEDEELVDDCNLVKRPVIGTDGSINLASSFKV